MTDLGLPQIPTGLAPLQGPARQSTQPCPPVPFSFLSTTPHQSPRHNPLPNPTKPRPINFPNHLRPPLFTPHNHRHSPIPALPIPSLPIATPPIRTAPYLTSQSV